MLLLWLTFFVGGNFRRLNILLSFQHDTLLSPQGSQDTTGVNVGSGLLRWAIMWWEPLAWARLSFGYLMVKIDPRRKGTTRALRLSLLESLKGLSTLQCCWIDLPALPPWNPWFVGISSKLTISFLFPATVLPSSWWQSTARLYRVCMRCLELLTGF